MPRIFGPVKATLLVQIPSGVFSILIPFAANHLSVSILLLNCFFGTAAMDVTSRQILLTNLIRPADLTKVMGIVNIGKTFARCIGPIFTGILANLDYLWLCYIISGVLVIVADCILACSFFYMLIRLYWHRLMGSEWRDWIQNITHTHIYIYIKFMQVYFSSWHILSKLRF